MLDNLHTNNKKSMFTKNAAISSKKRQLVTLEIIKKIKVFV